jgi:hypothetical protein
MKTIYNTQFFRLYVSTGINLKEASVLKIIYKSPDRSVGEWTATLDPVDNTRMYYDCPGLNKIGRWDIYAKVTFPQGVIPGSITSITAVSEGTKI